MDGPAAEALTLAGTLLLVVSLIIFIFNLVPCILATSILLVSLTILTMGVWNIG